MAMQEGLSVLCGNGTDGVYRGREGHAPQHRRDARARVCTWVLIIAPRVAQLRA
jgi:hypothetical protein